MALILSSIDINQCNALDVFTGIAGNKLADGERNWGRLVVVFVIAAHTCKEAFGESTSGIKFH